MNTPIISSTGHPLFQIRAETPRLRRSLSRVLWHRFLTWMEKATPHAMFSLLTKLLTVAVIGLVVMAPQFLLGVLTDAATWNGYRIPAFLTLLAVTLYAKPALRWTRRTRIKQRGGNQHTYHGIPVAEFAEWLYAESAFKIDTATKKWAFSKDKYYAIANELDKHGLLERGEKNARVLRKITYADLVYQLKDGRFPLVWDEVGECWVEKDDPYGRHLREKSFRARKLEETTERKERKVERLDRQIEERQTTLSVADVLSLAG